MIAYGAILPAAPERAAKVDVTLGARRRFWQRRRWLPTFDVEAVLDVFELYKPNADGGDHRLWIMPSEEPIPGGAYIHVSNPSEGRWLYQVVLDMSLSAHELSKALYHELEHCWQSLMFTTGGAFHTATHWAAVEGSLTGLGSWYEERARWAEDLHYRRPLVLLRRETR